MLDTILQGNVLLKTVPTDDIVLQTLSDHGVLDVLSADPEPVKRALITIDVVSSLALPSSVAAYLGRYGDRVVPLTERVCRPIDVTDPELDAWREGFGLVFSSLPQTTNMQNPFPSRAAADAYNLGILALGAHYHVDALASLTEAFYAAVKNERLQRPFSIVATPLLSVSLAEVLTLRGLDFEMVCVVPTSRMFMSSLLSLESQLSPQLKAKWTDMIAEGVVDSSQGMNYRQYAAMKYLQRSLGTVAGGGSNGIGLTALWNLYTAAYALHFSGKVGGRLAVRTLDLFS